MFKIDWEHLRYLIADKLFNSELDEAYHDGLREGADFALQKTGMAVHRDTELTKTQKQGYDVAVMRYEEARKVVEERLRIRA